ncbi:hypothetical protein GGD38_007269 [Chitinophagaceae bacterium OAS944]|nr:hypothetical protein [Chitinophagaceae bacterium OAS944]
MQYIVEGARSIRQFTIPQFKDFEVVDAFDYPLDFGNGGGSYAKVVVLITSKKGRFTVPGATAVLNGKYMRASTASISVMPDVQGLYNIDPDDIDTEEESVLHPGDDITDKIAKNLFLRVESSKNTCYVGEPLMVVYKAYSRLNAAMQVAKRPSLTGFSVMEMVDNYGGKPEIEKLNGRLYYTNLVRKVQLFPLQEGTYTLDPAEIESLIHFIKTDKPAGKKGMLPGQSSTPMFPTAINHRTLLRSQPLTITVKSLPAANQPDDFSGAVGQFNVTVKVPATPIHKGDLVKIQVIISGSGNLSLLTPPHVKWPKGVDTAEPSVKEDINKYVFPLTGSKTFEYSFAAPDTGDYKIPAIHLSYYDPVDKKYKKASNDSIILHVLPGVTKSDAEAEAMKAQKAPGIPAHYYWFAIIVLAIIGSIVYQVISLKKGKKKEIAKVQAAAPVQVKPSAQVMATQLLTKARLAIQYQQAPIFYHEIEQALWQVVADNWKVLPSKMNRHHITQLLAEQQVPAYIIQSFSAILNECEWALYTPGHSVSNMEATIEKTEGLLKELLEIKA